MSSIASCSDALPACLRFSKIRFCFVFERMRLNASSASSPLDAFLTSRQVASNVLSVPRVANAIPSAYLLKGPSKSLHCSQALLRKSLGSPVAVTCVFPFAEIASRWVELLSRDVIKRSSIRQPKSYTWAWTLVAPPPTPGTCSPERDLAISQALTKSSKSNPAPLLDLTVADVGFLDLPVCSTGFGLPLEGAICFLIPSLFVPHNENAQQSMCAVRLHLSAGVAPTA